MSNSVAEGDLFAYTFDHFHSLKALLNCFKEKENYDFYENYYNWDCQCQSQNCTHKARIYHFYCKQQNLGFRVVYYPLLKKFHITIENKNIHSSPFYFKAFHNSYVYHHLKEIVILWTRLNIKYKTFDYCEKILNDYILYKQNIENYLIMIEVGARFRNQCIMHIFPLEVQKKVYDTVVKACCDGKLKECEEFAEGLFQ
jgi:hypothetical protein